MKRKKIIIASLILLIGIILILSTIISNNNLKKKNNLENLIVSKIIATSDNSLSFTITNNTNKKITNKKVMVYLTDNKKNIIMTFPLDINNLGVRKTIKEEYYQEFLFDIIPSHGYIKEYNDNTNKIKENIALDSKLNNLLKDKAIKVIEQHYKNTKELELIITADDIEKKYNIDLEDFKNKKYGCSLTESFVEIKITNFNSSYTPYLNCEILTSEKSLEISKEK